VGDRDGLGVHCSRWCVRLDRRNDVQHFDVPGCTSCRHFMRREHQVEKAGRPVSSWRLGLVLALALFAISAGCGGQRASTASPSSSDRPPQDIPASESPSSDIFSRESADFGLLRTPPDGIPFAIRRTLKIPVHGMRWNLARQIPVSIPGAYWLVPGTRDLCIVAVSTDSPSVGTVCATIAQALLHGIANTSLDPTSGIRTIVGIARDGTRSVAMQSAKSSTSIRVRHGLFTLRDSVAEPPSDFILH
jgi:hypothetical protein